MDEQKRPMGSGDTIIQERATPQQGYPDLDSDVEHIHRPLFREPRDPTEGRERAPWWLWAITALALFWGGWYLGRHGGTFSAVPHLDFPRLEGYVAQQATEQSTQTTTDPVQAGQLVYTKNCQTCHQQNGRGLPGVFPPLIGSEWVTGPPKTPVRILLKGLHQPMEVAGATYNGVMPAWGETLSDKEIAAVVTFIRQWEPNDAGEVKSDLVRQLRAETSDRAQPWTPDELRALEAE